jgi:hypothetical protein
MTYVDPIRYVPYPRNFPASPFRDQFGKHVEAQPLAFAIWRTVIVLHHHSPGFGRMQLVEQWVTMRSGIGHGVSSHECGSVCCRGRRLRRGLPRIFSVCFPKNSNVAQTWSQHYPDQSEYNSPSKVKPLGSADHFVYFRCGPFGSSNGLYNSWQPCLTVSTVIGVHDGKLGV